MANIPLGLELQSFWTDDQDAINNSESFNIPIPDESIITKPIMFYNVDNVKPNGPDMCYVNSGMDEYCINESYESVIAKINERMIFKFN